jgi:beta-N-acetylhexosaminidase
MLKRLLRALPASALLAAVACAPRQSTPEMGVGRSTLDARSSRWVDSTLRAMSLRDKAAQMVWPWMLGDFTPEQSPEWRRLRTLVAEQRVGGVIVSLGSPTEIAAKLNALQRAASVPLLVGADLESGAAYRARGGFATPNAIDLGGATMFPPQMAIGATGDTALAYAMGRATAVEGRAMGIQVAFAPVLDVNNNPDNPVINVRSFGEDPRAVARLGAAFIRGVQEHGMVATAKHFPGHGDTRSNSHLELARVDASRSRIDSVEFVPFRAAIGAGVGAVMSFHGNVPALDPSGVPATLSRHVITDLLRDSLGFGGLVISDALDMRGVLAQVGPVEAAKRIVEAGVDVLLMPADVPGTIDAIVAGVREGRYSEARLDGSVRRLLEMKARVGLPRRRTVDLDSVRVVLGDSLAAAAAREVAERSVTLVKDSLALLPLGRLNEGARVLSVTYARRPDLSAGVAFNTELRRKFPSLRAEWVDAEQERADYQRLLQAADSADVVVVGYYDAASPSQATTSGAPPAFASFLDDLIARGARPVVVSFGTPYVLRQVPSTPAYVLAWGAWPVSQTAAARALLGAAPITGRLPITIPPLASLGAGEQRPVVRTAAQ